MTITLAMLLTTCAPLVHPTTLRALIEVESGGNPYAVSINRPQTLTNAGIQVPTIPEPHSASDAVELTQKLLVQGLSTSVGLAQINIEQLAGRHLRLKDLFDPCTNLAVAQSVLLECARNQPPHLPSSPARRLRDTLLCYNTGRYTAAAPDLYPSKIMRAAVRQHEREAGRPRGGA